MEGQLLGTLFLLMVKHTIADYFTQYKWMMKDKATYGAWGGLAHAGWHGILTFLVLYWNPFAVMSTLLMIILLSIIDSVFHYHIDYVKSNIWKSKQLTPIDQLYWAVHGVDQFLHMATYILIIYILSIL